jgi:5-methylcytosine-specific restriction endonuclease McrA
MILRNRRVSSKKPYRQRNQTIEKPACSGSVSPAEILPEFFSDTLCSLAVKKHSKVDRHEWEKAISFFGHKCAYCTKPFGGDILATRDHVVPKTRGGKTNIHNLVPSCLRCNSEKGHKVVGDFANIAAMYRIKDYMTSVSTASMPDDEWDATIARIEALLATIG